MFLVLGTQHGLRRYVEECKLLCFTRINSRSALLMRRLLPLLLLLGAGPPAPVLRLQGNWQSLAPPLRLDWTCFSLGQRRRLNLTSLAQRRVGLCSTATSPASHAITLARVEVSHRLAAGGITRQRVPTHDGDILLVRNRHVSERRWFTIGIPQLLAHLSLSLSPSPAQLVARLGGGGPQRGDKPVGCWAGPLVLPPSLFVLPPRERPTTTATLSSLSLPHILSTLSRSGPAVLHFRRHGVPVACPPLWPLCFWTSTMDELLSDR